MKNIFAILLFFLSNFVIGQNLNKMDSCLTNSFCYKQGVSLDSILHIDSITKVTIRNINGKHELNKSELINFKKMLKNSYSIGGLFVKPGHVFIELTFKNTCILKKSFIYGSIDLINFDYGYDKWGNRFSGSFRLSKGFNFDNYK